MALDWQVLIVAFAAISLQIMTSIKLMLADLRLECLAFYVPV